MLLLTLSSFSLPMIKSSPLTLPDTWTIGNRFISSFRDGTRGSSFSASFPSLTTKKRNIHLNPFFLNKLKFSFYYNSLLSLSPFFL